MNKKHKINLESSLSGESKFITDASLVRLAKWLRLLGYDTVVFPSEAGRNLLRQADSEGRIILTRRRDMAERQFSGTLFLITDMTVGSRP